MWMRWGACSLLVTASLWASDWSPRKAADYLDGRQKEWFAWPTANASGTPCVSCHTGLTYLLVRPALRRALGESAPTQYETGLLDALRTRVEKKASQDLTPASGKTPVAAQSLGVESIFSALLLETRPALQQMWALQHRDGNLKGAWAWFSLELDPWEMPESSYFGATLAALAVGGAPNDDRDPERVAELTAYLRREAAAQPLQNRLMLLWAATRLPETLEPGVRKTILDDAWKKQQADGSWSMDLLGPFEKHVKAPASKGNTAYATGLTAFLLERAGIPQSDPRLARALGWLKSHQAPEGYWDGESMNKQYPADSMEIRFMRDAATGFAAMALLDAKP
jgi:squalene-hopene/tetraprenyl-beta-curcumene cyclase